VEIDEETDSLCSLTVTHDVTGAPFHGAATVGRCPRQAQRGRRRLAVRSQRPRVSARDRRGLRVL